MNRFFLILGLGLAATVTSLSVAGCSEKIAPPQIVTEVVAIGGISPKGADIQATLDVTNPNDVVLSATGVESKITIGDKPNVAKATMTDPLILPGRTHTKPKISIKIEWLDAAQMTALAQAKQPAPYIVEGSADFSTPKGLIAKTPFTIRGMMSPEELAKAAGSAGADAGK